MKKKALNNTHLNRYQFQLDNVKNQVSTDE